MSSLRYHIQYSNSIRAFKGNESMSQLIQMRQRIKAVETIKKITHAMRLISMSSHSRIRSKKSNFELYQREIQSLFFHLKGTVDTWSNTILYPESSQTQRNLIILVGSQKGLCGNFNSQIFSFFEKNINSKDLQRSDLCIIGSKAYEYAESLEKKPVLIFKEFTSLTVNSIALSITNHIFNASPSYTSVTIFGNYPKSFFAQRPQKTPLIPFEIKADTQSSQDEYLQDYLWEQDPVALLNDFAEKLLTIRIQNVLFDSLIAEQAARFIAMDNSTRNASTLLDTMKLQYNKLRQAKITRELTDLIGSF
jgi:F-type H+-transporting ATPase subunit gamma